MNHHISTLLESLEYLIRIREPNTGQFGCPSVSRFIAFSPFSPGVKYTPAGAALDSVMDTYAVFQQQDPSNSDMHPYSWPAKVKYGLRGYEKVFHSKANNEIYYLRNIDQEQGCFVVLRLGQHVANILKAVFVNGN